MYFYNQKPIRLIELFAGIGSQAKALKNLGIDFEHWYVCEFDKYAIQSYNAVHSTNFTTSDVTKITANDLNVTDTEHFTYLLTYSFPCQDLSNAGKGRGMEKGSGTRSGLLWEVERLLNECTELPQVLLMENVPQVHSIKNKEHFDQWIEFLKSKGYSNYWQDLNAKDYGIPQSRNRCYMVSIRGEYSYEFPQPIPLDFRLRDMLEQKVDEKYYLSDEAITGRTNSNFRQYNLERSLINDKDIHPTILARYDGSPTLLKEDDATHEPKIIREEPLERDGWHNHAKEVLSTDGLCRTLCAQSNNTLTKIKEPRSLRIRKLTPKECWRLMGFDDEDVERAAAVCSNSQLYKQAGNSIVVDVLVAIFRELFVPKKTRSQWLDDLLNN